jgi:hypothetical protein
VTNAEKLTRYEAIVEIIEDHLKLFKHQKEARLDFRCREESQADAYRRIVFVVRGFDKPSGL